MDIDVEAVTDSVPKRVVLDAASPNTHGKELIEFVRDVGMVVLQNQVINAEGEVLSEPR